MYIEIIIVISYLKNHVTHKSQKNTTRHDFRLTRLYCRVRIENFDTINNNNIDLMCWV